METKQKMEKILEKFFQQYKKNEKNSGKNFLAVQKNEQF